MMMMIVDYEMNKLELFFTLNNISMTPLILCLFFIHLLSQCNQLHENNLHHVVPHKVSMGKEEEEGVDNCNDQNTPKRYKSAEK
jgi:hypothetical protein